MPDGHASHFHQIDILPLYMLHRRQTPYSTFATKLFNRSHLTARLVPAKTEMLSE